MTQLSFDMEPLPLHLTILEQRAKKELATPKMKTAGYETMKTFTTERIKWRMENGSQEIF